MQFWGVHITCLGDIWSTSVSGFGGWGFGGSGFGGWGFGGSGFGGLGFGGWGLGGIGNNVSQHLPVDLVPQSHFYIIKFSLKNF